MMGWRGRDKQRWGRRIIREHKKILRGHVPYLDYSDGFTGMDT
jgi:hypothetical protein